MKDIYIVSDAHGRYDALRKALYGAGLFDNPNAYIVQIGDLANCVRDSVEGDLKCLSMVGKEIDLMLIGNHEIPYFDADNSFSGFYHSTVVGDTLWELYEGGLLSPAYDFGGTLVSHAGITQSQLNLGTGRTSEEVWSKLAYEWAQKHFGHFLFRDCGLVRYGRSAVGGILWCDFDREFQPTEFPQIVGHTPGILRQKGNALCIDTGAKYDGVPTVLKLEV